MSLDAIDTDRSSSHLASFDEDPVLARVQASLASSGGDVSAMSIGGASGSGGTGQEMMMAMLAAKTAEPAPSGMGNYHSEQGSSAGPAIAAGIAGLAIGAGVGALIAGSGGDDTTAATASDAAPAPAPQADSPPAPTTQPAAAPAAKAPSKPASTPAAPAKPEPKPAAAPVPTASARPDLGLLPDMIQGPKTDRNGNVVWSSGASAPAKPATAARPTATKPAATASTSAFRLQVTPLPAIPSPDEVAAGASLPRPVASTGPTEPAADPTQADISILYQ